MIFGKGRNCDKFFMSPQKACPNYQLDADRAGALARRRIIAYSIVASVAAGEKARKILEIPAIYESANPAGSLGKEPYVSRAWGTTIMLNSHRWLGLL